MSNLKVVLNAANYKPSRAGDIPTKTIMKNGVEIKYYKVRLGAFNIFNSSKDFYTAEGVKELINDPRSFFYRRLKKGYLLGEMDHPKFMPGMTMAEFLNRNATYDMNNVAFHVEEVELIETTEKVNMAGNYGNVIIVEGWITPSGPKGVYLKEALENPNRNVAFSVRSLSKDTVINGVVVKHTTAILAWDWVTEPGINNANTFDMLNSKVVNTESINNTLTLELKETDLNSSNNSTNVNQESEDLNILNTTIRSMFSKKPVSRVLSW